MKIQLLSDTHSHLDRFKINKEADLIIHAGDFTNKLDGINQIVKFSDLCEDHGTPYVIVLGNHDFWNNTIENTFKELDQGPLNA